MNLNPFKRFDEKVRKEIEREYEITIGHEIDCNIKLNEQLEEMTKKYAELLQKSTNSPEYASRIADLEVKMAKLWGLLITQSPRTKEEMLSKTGKRFGGQARALLKQ